MLWGSWPPGMGAKGRRAERSNGRTLLPSAVKQHRKGCPQEDKVARQPLATEKDNQET